MDALAAGRSPTCGNGVVVTAAAALSVLAAYVVVQQPELFNLAGVASPRGLTLLLAGLLLGAVCLRFPDAALCCLVAFVSLNLSDVLVRSHGLPSLLQLSFVPLALAGWWNAAPGSRTPPLAITTLLCGYLVVVLCSTTIAPDRAAADARLLEQLRGFAIFVVVVMLARSAVSLRRAAWTFVFCASLLSTLALIQILTGDVTQDFGGLARIKYAQIYGTTFEPRIAGPLGDPNFFAQILTPAIPIALALAWSESDIGRRVLAFLGAGMAAIAIVFTYSRGGALALGVVVLVSFVVRGVSLRTLSFGLVPVVILVWLALPDDFAQRLTTLSQLLPGSDAVLRPDSSFGERKLFTAAAWRMFEDAPLIGVGVGNYGFHFLQYAQLVGSDARLYVTPTEGYYAHNLYLEIAAETGLVGLTLFALALAACFIYLWRARIALLKEGDLSSAGLAAGCSIAMGGYLVSSLFLHGDFIRYWWLIVGIAAALYRLAPARQPVLQESDGWKAPVPIEDAPPLAEEPCARNDGRPTMPAAAVRPAVAVIVSRFPLITETFILREIIEMERQGQPVLLVPLLEERAAIVHREAEPWIARALYTPFVSMPILAANIRMLGRRPLRYLHILWRIAAGTIASPNFFVRSLALFPKSVFLAERFEREGIRHVHAHYATHPTTVALTVWALTDVTFSFTVHAHDIFVRRALLGWKLEAASFVRSISRFNRTFLSRHYPDALVRKVDVIHVGVDPDLYAATSHDPSGQRCGARILCVASLQQYKGIPVLLDACDLLRRRGIEFTCTIVGEGPMRAALERQLRRLALERRVTLAGGRPQNEVAALMQTATLLVLPSVVAPDGQMEGIPVVLMEAMASRLPVVASSLSGIPEAVEHLTTGILVEPGSASALAIGIERVLADGHTSRQMGERARGAIVREFRLDVCVSRLLRRIDRYNPPPDDASAIRLPVLRAGIASNVIGLRRRLERRDSQIAQLVIANGANGGAPHDVILKIHKSRPGESRPPAERARKEFDLLNALTRMPINAASVPRPLFLDAEGACLLMESCRGESLETLVRIGRLTRDGSRKRDLTSAVRRTGAWLRRFQQSTPRIGDPALALERLVATATDHLDRCRGEHLPAPAANAVRSQLEALKTRLAPASLRLAGVHGDFWPGNVFIADDMVQVIDFEGSDEGLPYEDVAYFLVQLAQFFPGPFLQRRFKPLGAAFLAGYLQADDRFDWTAYELCRIAAALQILTSIPTDAHMLRARWRRRMLCGTIVGEAA